MSARELLETIVGSDWDFICAMCGMVLALHSVSSLVSSASPPAALVKVTWMFGLALFQTATILSMFGTQDRKVRFTFWLAPAEAEALPALLDEQPAARAIAATPHAAVVTARESFIATPRREFTERGNTG